MMSTPRKFLSILFLAITIVSCSKEDMDNDTDLNGEWKLIAINLTTPIDLDADGIVDTNLIDVAPIIDGELEFSGTQGSYFYASSVSFNSAFNDGKLMLLIASSIPPGHSASSFSFTDSNDQIIIDADITFNSALNSSSVLSRVDENTMTMSVPNGLVVTDENSFEVTVSQDVQYEFVKN